MVARMRRKTRQSRARFLVDWEPPPDYEPMPGLGGYLKRISPTMNTAEMDMVIYWDWRTRPFWRKSVTRAWRDLGMTPAHAQDGFAKTITPMEIYGQAVARAKGTAQRARARRMPRT